MRVNQDLGLVGRDQPGAVRAATFLRSLAKAVATAFIALASARVVIAASSGFRRRRGTPSSPHAPELA
jgi:hypothetical protein